MMLVATFALGVLAQIVATLGLSWWFYAGLRLFGRNRAPGAAAAFAVGQIFESTFLALLSFAHLLDSGFLLRYFLIKCLIGLLVLLGALRRKSFDCLSGLPWWIWIWASALCLATSVPTGNYDAFTAHFAVIRLFLESGGLPVRPDYEYLDAVPLAIHMLMLSPLSVGLEGGANIIASIHAFMIYLLVRERWGKKVSTFAALLLLAMPEFQMLSRNPMVDIPSCFFVLCGLAHLPRCLKHPRRHSSLVLTCLNWSFLAGIKHTLVIFPLAAGGLCCLALLRRRLSLAAAVGILSLMLLAATPWYVKTWSVHGNPFHPHLFSGSHPPLIPGEHRPPVQTFDFEAVTQYALTVFADTRWWLSFGPWPLILLPLLFLRAGRSPVLGLALILFFAGLVLTLYFTPFKNRYFMPYIFVLLPWLAACAGRAGVAVRALLLLTAVGVSLLGAPYVLQPLHAALKGHSRDSYYSSKFPNYTSIRRLDGLPEGRILFVGTPVWWVERDHLLSIYGETHIDYSRLESLNELVEILRRENIRFVAIDRAMLEQISRHPDPWYSAKRYLASRCRFWMDELRHAPGTLQLWEESGLQVLELSSPNSLDLQR